MSVMDHLRELRRRIIWMLLIVAVRCDLRLDLLQPRSSTSSSIRTARCRRSIRFTQNGTGCVLVYHGVLDGFTTRLKVSVIAGAVLTAPFWLYQLWAFITPGLRKNERKYTIIFVIVSTVLFVGRHVARVPRPRQGFEDRDRAGRLRHRRTVDRQ